MRHTNTGSLKGVQLRLGQARPPTFQRAIARAGLGAHVTVDVAVDAVVHGLELAGDLRGKSVGAQGAITESLDC